MQQDHFNVFTVSVGKLYKQIQRLKSAGMKQYGLKGAHVSILHLLAGRTEGVSFQEICQICDLDRALVSRELGDLVHQGYIRKDSKDGVYHAKYYATPKAEEILPEFISIIEGVQRKADEGISEEELAVFYRVLEQLRKNLEDLDFNERD
ncbi:MAG: MarR family winged helix-turn-helix transcriptional regulator [Lachnospiraceae bacterium]